MMKQIQLEKITLNIGVGRDEKKLERGFKLIKTIAGKEPVKTFTQKRIPSWGLRPGLPIGCKLTIRGKQAEKITKQLLEANENKISSKQISKTGTIAFGIKEYMEIPGTKYDPEIGVMGLEACLTLKRPGFRIKHRKIKQKKIGKKHIITSEDAKKFLQEKFNVKVKEE